MLREHMQGQKPYLACSENTYNNKKHTWHAPQAVSRCDALGTGHSQPSGLLPHSHAVSWLHVQDWPQAWLGPRGAGQCQRAAIRSANVAARLRRPPRARSHSFCRAQACPLHTGMPLDACIKVSTRVEASQLHAPCPVSGICFQNVLHNSGTSAIGISLIHSSMRILQLSAHDMRSETGWV